MLDERGKLTEKGIMVNLFTEHELWQNTLGKEGKRLLIKNENMTGLDLSNKNLSNCALLGVILDCSNMSKADLYGSNLGGSSFKSADLTEIILVKAEANQACFEKANLSNANAFRATFFGADFKEANLTGVNFSRSLLDDADFAGATISGCRFFEAGLDRVKGLDSVVLDWIDVGSEEAPQKIYGAQGIKWLRGAGER
jgi:uncharacterized protein YjbI with pentapeptide repeats